MAPFRSNRRGARRGLAQIVRLAAKLSGEHAQAGDCEAKQQG
jgi:hypothetical protein